MPGEGHAYYPYLAFLLYITSTALIMGWLYNASGKKLVTAWIMHAAGNTAVPLFPVLRAANVPQPGYWLWAGLNALVALGLTIWFRRKRNFINSERAA
jgi:LPXTG-motif cell wall-anchored protein